MDRETTPLLIDPAEAAKRLGVPLRMLVEWRRRGVGPAYIQIAGPRSKIMYCHSDLEEWVEAHRKLPSDQ